MYFVHHWETVNASSWLTPTAGGESKRDGYRWAGSYHHSVAVVTTARQCSSHAHACTHTRSPRVGTVLVEQSQYAFWGVWCPPLCWGSFHRKGSGVMTCMRASVCVCFIQTVERKQFFVWRHCNGLWALLGGFTFEIYYQMILIKRLQLKWS